jgi:hypothetical protein
MTGVSILYLEEVRQLIDYYYRIFVICSKFTRLYQYKIEMIRIERELGLNMDLQTNYAIATH